MEGEGKETDQDLLAQVVQEIKEMKDEIKEIKAYEENLIASKLTQDDLRDQKDEKKRENNELIQLGEKKNISLTKASGFHPRGKLFH